MGAACPLSRQSRKRWRVESRWLSDVAHACTVRPCTRQHQQSEATCSIPRARRYARCLHATEQNFASLRLGVKIVRHTLQRVRAAIRRRFRRSRCAHRFEHTRAGQSSLNRMRCPQPLQVASIVVRSCFGLQARIAHRDGFVLAEIQLAAPDSRPDHIFADHVGRGVATERLFAPRAVPGVLEIGLWRGWPLEHGVMDVRSFGAAPIVHP